MRRLLLPALLFAALAIGMTVPSVMCLSISSRKHPGKMVLSTRALSGFTISYTHSVNKGRVRDYYLVQDGMIVLHKTEFVSYGAGIPEAYETAGAEFTVTKSGYAITGLDRRLRQMVMAVGVIAGHSFSAGDNDVPLTDYFEPQTSLVFEARKVPLAAYIFSKHI